MFKRNCFVYTKGVQSGPESYDRTLIGALIARLRVWFQWLEVMSLVTLVSVDFRHEAIPFRRILNTVPLGQGLCSEIQNETGV